MMSKLTFTTVELLVSMSKLENWQVVQYVRLLEEFRKGDKFSDEEIRKFTDWLWTAPCRKTSMILWLMDADNQMLVGTAQASLIPKFRPTVFIDDVVISPDCRGLGHGKSLMQKLMRRVNKRWDKVKRFELTNNPKRGNSQFYIKLGFTKYETDFYRLDQSVG